MFTAVLLQPRTEAHNLMKMPTEFEQIKIGHTFISPSARGASPRMSKRTSELEIVVLHRPLGQVNTNMLLNVWQNGKNL